MASLWLQSAPEAWQAALDGYREAVAGLGKERLPDLDRWFREELPVALRSRQPPHLTHPELVKLVDWKLLRGKWRPRLLDFAKQADPGGVEAASRAAFQALGEPGSSSGAGCSKAAAEPTEAAIKQALAELCVLKGVGPATASAALEAFNPTVPFTSDQAMLAALNSKDYTVPKVLELTNALRKKAAALSKASGRQWTAQEVEQALFAAAVGGGSGSSGAAGGSSGAAGGSGSGKKRKR
ncbi:hypothetical protein C2E21_1882 [Chlorella sorokiniana]|uniref:Uncharacterized protein n=1 Tax=Chlorella sorokiniana TaxID=3076 RepID=A0A2P6U0U1_CHLSO|nr:hypothetical protein C2E21_1882 [Chlorella sorokiniana]|eukprot:PRW59936.1 hypothetical protein C2E21_1882 [Chlorella sorokiniana]